MQVNVNWETMKEFIVSRNLNIQWVLINDEYKIFSTNGVIQISCIIINEDPASDDQIDFETNFKFLSSSNTNDIIQSSSEKQNSLLTELQLKADLTETQPISVTSLPLPMDAATSANQATEITSLSIISTNTNNTNISVQNTQGTVTAGTAATKSELVGGQFNTVLPILIDTQQAALQVDSSSRLIIAPLTSTSVTTAAEDHNFGTVGDNTLRTAAEIGNSTGAADFNAGATGAQTLRTNANQGAPNTSANAWPHIITDGTDTALVTTNGELKVNDGLRNGGVYGTLTLTTGGTAYEAKVGGSRLTNRKSLIIIPQDNMFWGYDNTVTTSSGLPIYRDQLLVFDIDPDSTFQIWLVASSASKTAKIAESP